jgi:hypothetical protein
MAIVDQLIAVLQFNLKGEADLKKFQSGLDGLEKSARSVGRTLGVVAAAAGAAVAAGVGLLARNVISVNAQFEKYQATLETIEGSAEKAKNSLDWIANFAKTTPYEVDELTQSFVKLKSYGLDPMDGTMTVLGDTAAAMGKTLNQAVEAFADATSNEFERLKEFGIRSNQTKDSVTFTWIEGGKEMTKTMAKNSKEILGFLNETMGRKFSGAMLRQSKTWSGMMSNLSDSWSDFMRRIGNAGFFDTVKRRLADVLDTLARWSEDGTIDKASTALSGAFTAAAEGASVVLERLRNHVAWLNENWEKWGPIVKTVGGGLLLLIARAFPLISTFTLLAAAFDDILTKFQGGDSVTGRLIEKFKDFNNWVKELWKSLKEFLEGIPKWAEDVHKAFHDFGRDLGQKLLEGLRSVGQDIKQWFIDLIPDWAKSFFGLDGSGYSTGGSFGGEGFRTGGRLGRVNYDRSIRYGDSGAGTGPRNGTILPVGNTRVPVVIRNNNPAALSLMRPGSGEFAERQAGYVGATRRPRNEGGYYAKYATPEHGVAANAELLKRYGRRGINTPDRIVRTWSEDRRAHPAYSRRIQAALGVSGNTRLDLNDPDVLQKILMEKSAHESGRGKPIWSEDVFRRGVRREFGPSPANSNAGGPANNFLGWKQKQESEAQSYKPQANNMNVNAPISINVAKSTEAPAATARAVQTAVNRVRPARMQASPAA